LYINRLESKPDRVERLLSDATRSRHSCKIKTREVKQKQKLLPFVLHVENDGLACMISLCRYLGLSHSAGGVG